MTKEEELISKERVAELGAMASGLYGTIVSLTQDPYEAVTVLTMIHLLIWMNNRKDNVSTEVMLADYSKNFLENFQASEAKQNKQMN